MTIEAGLSLRDFVRIHVAVDSQIERWEIVKNSDGPSPKPNPEPFGHSLIYEEPSANYVEWKRLIDILSAKLLEILNSGDWVVSGCVGLRIRQDLERSDWNTAPIQWTHDVIGSYRKVRVRAAEPQTKREILQKAIEEICGLIGEPIPGVRKEEIEGFCMRLFKDHHTFPDFQIAWKEAKIDKKWKTPGRPRKSKSD